MGDASFRPWLVTIVMTSKNDSRLSGLSASQQELVLEHLGLANWHANHFRSGLEAGDKDQIARYGLCCAARSFRGEPSEFARFASVWILGTLKQEHQRREKLRLGDQLCFELCQLYSERWLVQRGDWADRARIIPRQIAFRESRVSAVPA